MTSTTQTLSFPKYIAVPHDGDPEGAFVSLDRATVAELRECVKTRSARIYDLQDELLPLKTLLEVREHEGDDAIALVPGAHKALLDAFFNTFTDDDYQRLNALLSTDSKVVDLIISITRGCSIIEAAQRLVINGEADAKAGAGLIRLANVRAETDA